MMWVIYLISGNFSHILWLIITVSITVLKTDYENYALQVNCQNIDESSHQEVINLLVRNTCWSNQNKGFLKVTSNGMPEPKNKTKKINRLRKSILTAIPTEANLFQNNFSFTIFYSFKITTESVILKTFFNRKISNRLFFPFWLSVGYESQSVTNGRRFSPFSSAALVFLW